MKIITLETVDSTNKYLKNWADKENNLPNFLTVRAVSQTNGVGQYGAKWETESGKNLTFSTLMIHNNFPLENYFLLNMMVSITISDVLHSLHIPKISIKWPNDLLSGRFKIGGILIENIIRSSYIDKSIIGIGLNINQLHFNGIEKASSLKKITGQDFDLENLLKEIISQLEKNLSKIENTTLEDLHSVYMSKLFQKDKVSAFRSPEGYNFSGIIRNVTPKGELVVELENEIQKKFVLKELQLLY